MISDFNKTNILKEFPNIKLSYENVVYKKVYNTDIILAIPEGKKCFAWFTSLDDTNVCLIMEIAKNKQIYNIKIVNACFSNELSYGTILYGTLLYHKQNRFFAIEDIFSYKGKDIDRETWGDKLTILKNILSKDLKQISYNNSFIVFGLPVFSNNIEELTNKINHLTYNINSIQFRSYNRVNNYYTISFNKFMEKHDNSSTNNTVFQLPHEKPIIKPNINNTYNNTYNTNRNTNNTYNTYNTYNNRNILKREIIFKAKPDIQNDIYHLYGLNENYKEEYYNIAHIPDFKKSVFMNNLFRNIKENSNLDKLEESDDEEEFENEKEDKFVFLEKEYNIICSYNYKFKKWIPIKLAPPDSKIVLLKDLPNVEKK
jgi:hypothetical protein